MLLADRCMRAMDSLHLLKVDLLARGLALPPDLKIRGPQRLLLTTQMHILKAARIMRGWSESKAAKTFGAEAKAVKHNAATLAEWCRDKEALGRDVISKRYPNLGEELKVLTEACARDAKETAHYKRAPKRKPDLYTTISNHLTSTISMLEAANHPLPAKKVKDAKQEFEAARRGKSPSPSALNSQ